MSALDDELRSIFRFVSERVILPRWQNLASSEVEEKAKDDFVTIADKETEVFLTDALSKLAPDIAIVGEEAVHDDPSIMEHLSGPCWIIDPIDGTSNFARGEGHFAIMVALADAGEAVAGWIYDPRRDRLLSARRGEGAWINGEKLSAATSGEEPATLAAMKRFMLPEQRTLFEAEIEPHYRLVTAPGCAAEQYPLTAMGEHDLAMYERTLPWDHAAGCLFLNESGGACLRLDGSAYRVDDGRKGMVAAASPALFEQLAGKLNAIGYEPAAN